MNQAKEDLLLHPVRLRIIQAAGARQVTAQQLARELADIPQATLYRNINTLAAAGILTVVGERRVHNAVEKTYALAGQDQSLSYEDLQNAQPADYIRLFTRYLGQLLGYYVRYVQAGDVDFARDRVAFQMLPLYLSEAEMQQVGQAINAALLPHLQNQPSPERQRLILGVMSIPDAGGGPAAGSEGGTPEAAASGAAKA